MQAASSSRCDPCLDSSEWMSSSVFTINIVTVDARPSYPHVFLCQDPPRISLLAEVSSSRVDNGAALGPFGKEGVLRCCGDSYVICDDQVEQDSAVVMRLFCPKPFLHSANRYSVVCGKSTNTAVPGSPIIRWCTLCTSAQVPVYPAVAAILSPLSYDKVCGSHHIRSITPEKQKLATMTLLSRFPKPSSLKESSDIDYADTSFLFLAARNIAVEDDSSCSHSFGRPCSHSPNDKRAGTSRSGVRYRESTPRH